MPSTDKRKLDREAVRTLAELTENRDLLISIAAEDLEFHHSLSERIGVSLLADLASDLSPEQIVAKIAVAAQGKRDENRHQG